MTVTCLQIARITEGASGATVLHLVDGSISVVSPSWVAKNKPEVGGFLLDDGKMHGEQWFAKNSLNTLPAVLIEVQRITAKPGELILFKLPGKCTDEHGERLWEMVRGAAPDLPFIVVSGDGLEVQAVSAEKPE